MLPQDALELRSSDNHITPKKMSAQAAGGSTGPSQLSRWQHWRRSRPLAALMIGSAPPNDKTAHINATASISGASLEPAGPHGGADTTETARGGRVAHRRAQISGRGGTAGAARSAQYTPPRRRHGRRSLPAQPTAKVQENSQ